MTTEEFYLSIQNNFTDPLTGLKPWGEVQLTAILAHKIQTKAVDWQHVKAIEIIEAEATEEVTIGFMPEDGFVNCEHPLLAGDESQINCWGGMAADLMVHSRTSDRLVMMEAKVKGTFTYANDPPMGQLSRQFSYLDSLRMADRRFILITPEFSDDSTWYRERLMKAVEDFKKMEWASPIKFYHLHWEEILRHIKG